MLADRMERELKNYGLFLVACLIFGIAGGYGLGFLFGELRPLAKDLTVDINYYFEKKITLELEEGYRSGGFWEGDYRYEWEIRKVYDPRADYSKK